MLLKGILLVFIGITGLISTITFFLESIKTKKSDESVIYHKNLDNELYNSYMDDSISYDKSTLNNKLKPSNYYFEKKNIDSTTLLKEFQQNREIEETVLLDEDDRN